MSEVRIGIIGGSGLYEMEGLRQVRKVLPSTPFGVPSDGIVVGELEDVPVAFLARHGEGHRLTPAEVPARANVYALKSLGVERVISVSAVGSLREEVRPLDVVVPDQLIDRTKGRPDTFFGQGVVAHVSFADPVCPQLAEVLYQKARESKLPVHRGGTYVVIEGVAFSTRAESQLYRSWGASVIGMTALPEAKLAREAELCYAILALVTDYDVWHQGYGQVTADMVLANLGRNVVTAEDVLKQVVRELPSQRSCGCGTALDTAMVTAAQRVPTEARQRLGPLLSRYLAAKGERH
ncbi:MAG: S-methyl-5'-thioadenosine phosphorylase [Chloroflexi bacterium]|nr:S-methyl-5'-thioadenosine phosphorylase [Chloroflexota bacterium]